MAAVTICSDYGAQKNSLTLFPHLFPMKWWDQHTRQCRRPGSGRYGHDTHGRMVRPHCRLPIPTHHQQPSTRSSERTLGIGKQRKRTYIWKKTPPHHTPQVAQPPAMAMAQRRDRAHHCTMEIKRRAKEKKQPIFKNFNKKSPYNGCFFASIMQKIAVKILLLRNQKNR